MKHLRVKICGITRAEDALLAAELGAWAIGMIFVEGTPRYIEPFRAAQLARQLPAGVRRVGVFRDAPHAYIEETVETVGLDLIQLHGNETMADCRALGCERVIKAVVVQSEADVETALGYEVGWLLVDKAKTSSAKSGEMSSKTANNAGTVDLELAALVARQHGRTILAGGLTPTNVAEAVAEVCPWGIDLASGVEATPGIKHHGTMRALFDVIDREDYS